MNVNKGNPADKAHVDFQNTFDKALHQRLLKKGLGKAFLWTEGLLQDKKQQVFKVTSQDREEAVTESPEVIVSTSYIQHLHQPPGDGRALSTTPSVGVTLCSQTGFCEKDLSKQTEQQQMSFNAVNYMHDK